MKRGNENKRRERNKKEKQGMKKRVVDFLKEISEGPKKRCAILVIRRCSLARRF